MKSIEIEVDDELFAVIANDKQIQAMGISAFFGRVAKFLLELKAEYGIDVQFERAFSDPRVHDAFEEEMKKWIDEKVWRE